VRFNFFSGVFFLLFFDEGPTQNRRHRRHRRRTGRVGWPWCHGRPLSWGEGEWRQTRQCARCQRRQNIIPSETSLCSLSILYSPQKRVFLINGIARAPKWQQFILARVSFFSGHPSAPSTAVIRILMTSTIIN